jgi:hypothetical protein
MNNLNYDEIFNNWIRLKKKKKKKKKKGLSTLLSHIKQPTFSLMMEFPKE